MLNGTVVSNPPLVIQDEKGKKYSVVDSNCRLTYDVPRDRSIIAIGKQAWFHGKKTADGLTDVDTAWIQGTDLNSNSYLSGKAIKVSADKVTISNQFRGKPSDAIVTPNTPVYIATDVSAESVKIGAKIYVQAQTIPATDKVPEAKLARLIGVGGGPAIPISNDDPMIKTVEITGTLESFFPCRIKTESGEIINLIVPGQAQIASVKQGTVRDILSGDDVLAVGFDKDEVFTAKYILIRRKRAR